MERFFFLRVWVVAAVSPWPRPKIHFFVEPLATEVFVWSPRLRATLFFSPHPSPRMSFPDILRYAGQLLKVEGLCGACVTLTTPLSYSLWDRRSGHCRSCLRRRTRRFMTVRYFALLARLLPKVTTTVPPLDARPGPKLITSSIVRLLCSRDFFCCP